MEGSVFIFVFFFIIHRHLLIYFSLIFIFIIVYVFYIHFVNSFFFPCRFQVGPRQSPKASVFFRCP